MYLKYSNTSHSNTSSQTLQNSTERNTTEEDRPVQLPGSRFSLHKKCQNHIAKSTAMGYIVLSLIWQNTRNKVSSSGGCAELINPILTSKPNQRRQSHGESKFIKTRIFQDLKTERDRLRGQTTDAVPDFQQAAKQGGMGKCWGLLVLT